MFFVRKKKEWLIYINKKTKSGVPTDRTDSTTETRRISSSRCHGMLAPYPAVNGPWTSVQLRSARGWIDVPGFLQVVLWLLAPLLNCGGSSAPLQFSNNSSHLGPETLVHHYRTLPPYTHGSEPPTGHPIPPTADTPHDWTPGPQWQTIWRTTPEGMIHPSEPPLHHEMRALTTRPSHRVNRKRVKRWERWLRKLSRERQTRPKPKKPRYAGLETSQEVLTLRNARRADAPECPPNPLRASQLHYTKPESRESSNQCRRRPRYRPRLVKRKQVTLHEHRLERLWRSE